MRKDLIQEVEGNEKLFTHFSAPANRQRLVITRNRDIFCLDTWIVYLYYGQEEKEVFGVPFQDDLGELFRKIAGREEDLSRYRVSDAFLQGKKLPLSSEETVQCIEEGKSSKGYRTWYLKWRKGPEARFYQIAARSLETLVTTIARDSEV